MKNNNKTEEFKEKLKQALTSTARVISDDLDLKDDSNQNKSSKKFDFFNLENINSKNDFVKARAESDSLALKKKFSNDEIYKKNLPTNSSCKTLYSIAEKIRYETLGSKMLKGIKKNELYMLKKFHGVKLNSLTNNMLNFWENDFNQAIEKHIEFLKKM